MPRRGRVLLSARSACGPTFVALTVSPLMADMWTEAQYDPFVRDSYEHLNRVQDVAKRDFALGSYER